MGELRHGSSPIQDAGNARPRTRAEPGEAISGRESYAGVGRAQLNSCEFPDEMRISHSSKTSTAGVTVAGSFLDYVPRSSAASRQTQGHSERIRDEEDCHPQRADPHTRLRLLGLHGNTPAAVAFMDTPFQGYAANEVIVDIGDDADPLGDDKHKYPGDGRREAEKALPVIHKGFSIG